MTQFDAPTPMRGTPSSNIYSVLVFISFFCLAIAVGFVWYKNVQLTQGSFSFGANPFTIVQPEG
jgi:ABC-type transport system involved in cytochrome c biogenesis permease subunit